MNTAVPSLEEQLLRWCAKATPQGWMRYILHEPFFSPVLGGIECFSNGKRLVWRAAPGCEATKNAPDLTKANIVFDPAAINDWQAFPALDPVEPVTESKPCKECDGTGGLLPCEECEGTGRSECECCGQSTDCGDCDGDLWLLKYHPIGPLPPCEGCDGKGIHTSEAKRDPVAFGGIKLDPLYLFNASQLPGAVWRIGRQPASFGPDADALHVRWDGGGAVVMPWEGC